MPSLISKLVDISIETCLPHIRVGRVSIFLVEPYKRKDPPLIFCKDIDLNFYYLVWGESHQVYQ